MDLQDLQALGVNFSSQPWVSHPRRDRGTFVNPYRRQQDFSTTSGWASQVVGSAGHQTEPASMLGGAGFLERAIPILGYREYGPDDSYRNMQFTRMNMLERKRGKKHKKDRQRALAMRRAKHAALTPYRQAESKQPITTMQNIPSPGWQSRPIQPRDRALVHTQAGASDPLLGQPSAPDSLAAAGFDLSAQDENEKADAMISGLLPASKPHPVPEEEDGGPGAMTTQVST